MRGFVPFLLSSGVVCILLTARANLYIPAMKMFPILILLSFYHLCSFAQSKDQLGGLYLPSEGLIRVLIVYVQFPDDNFVPANNDLWPKGGNPKSMGKWLDKEWAGKPAPGSMTDYFYQMSLGKLKVIGDEISVTALNTREWYANQGWTRYNIHRQIIEKQLDPVMDFEKFDNWSLVNKFSHKEGPDGKIEFIFFIWRNVDMDLSAEKVTALTKKMDMGWVGSLGNRPPTEKDSKIYVDNGKRYFDSGTFGSGCTINNYFYKDAFRFSIHEFAHYLLGGNNFHNGHAFWAMLSGYEVRSFMINSWERYRLGWGDIVTLPKRTGTIKNAELTDFITTGKAFRIEIDSASNQYFFLEYHQGISSWDNCSSFPDDKGIFVIRQDDLGSGFSGAATWMKLIPAEGRYTWNIPRWEPSKWGSGNLPVFQKGIPDRDSGFLPTEFQMLTKPGDRPNIKSNFEIIYQQGDDGKTISEPLRTGRGRDAFRPGYNEVFSPWSNPNSQDKNRKETGIGFYVKRIQDNKAVIDIYFNTAFDAPPSKPQGLEVSIKNEKNRSFPVLKWQLNREPDVLNSSGVYIIERSINKMAFIQIAKVKGNISQYEDKDPGSGGIVTYRIMALDSKGLKSVYSDAAIIKFAR